MYTYFDISELIIWREEKLNCGSFKLRRNNTLPQTSKYYTYLRQNAAFYTLNVTWTQDSDLSIILLKTVNKANRSKYGQKCNETKNR